MCGIGFEKHEDGEEASGFLGVGRSTGAMFKDITVIWSKGEVGGCACGL